MNKTVLGVLASGRGSNLQSIIAAIENGRIKARIGVVITDKPDAGALVRAREAGIPAVCIDRRQCTGREDFEENLVEALKEAGVTLVVLAGFMRIVKAGLLSSYPHRVLNIHPALLPAFPGIDAWEQALDYGAKVAGCTVHFVDQGTDTGPIILQKCVPVFDTDTSETLHARIQKQEHVAYPEALALLADGRLRVEGRRVASSK